MSTPSITEDPAAFFSSLPTAPEPVPEEKKADDSQKPAAGTSITENPEAFFASLPHAQADQGQQNPVGQFAALTKDLSPEKFDREHLGIMSQWSPQDWHDFSQIRPDFPIPEPEYRKLWEAKRAGQIKDNGPSLGEQAADLGKTVAQGAVDIGSFYTDNPLTRPYWLPALPKPATDWLAQQMGLQPAASKAQTVRSMLSKPLQLGEAAVRLGESLGAGLDPWGLVDKVSEYFGRSTPEDTYQKDLARQQMRQAMAARDRENPTIYSRLLAEHPESAEAAAKGWLTLTGATQHLTPEQTDQAAKATAARWVETEREPVSPGAELIGSFAAPGGLGMEEFGVMGAGLGLGRQALRIPGIVRGVEAAQAAERAKLAAQVEKASTPSSFTQAMAGTAKALDNLSTAIDDFKDARPMTYRALTTLPGAVVGSAVGSHEWEGHPTAGGVLGFLAGGLGEGALAKGLENVDLVEAAANAPKLLADLGQAKAAVATGGAVGTGGRMFELAGASPESGKLTQKLFGGTRGRMLDRLSDLAGDYLTAGAHNAALGLAVGAIKGDDWEDTRNTILQGLLYGGLHQTFGKAMGSDPADILRQNRRLDADIYKTLQQLSPESQDSVLHMMDWDNHLKILSDRLNRAQIAHGDAVQRGDTEEAQELGKNVKSLSDMVRMSQNADLATRQAYAREVGKILAAGNDAINGPFREGQKNVKTEILTTDQIAQRWLASNPSRFTPTAQEAAAMGLHTPQQIQAEAFRRARARAALGHFFSAAGTGTTYEAGGSLPDALRAEGEGLVFDPLHSTVVVNADNIVNYASEGAYSLADALRHELGHALDAIPQFRDLMTAAGVDRLLFDQTIKDPDGTRTTVSTGQFSDKDLVDLYFNRYLKGVNRLPGESLEEAKKRFGRQQGFWSQGAGWNEDAIAKYMQSEIRADLYGRGLGDSRLDSLSPEDQHQLSWAKLNVANTLASRAIRTLRGSGVDDPYASPFASRPRSVATGAEFTPEVLGAYEKAFGAFRDLHGAVSQVSGEDSVKPMISPLQMAKSASLRAKYGRDSGLFKTEFRATVYDKDGNAVGVTNLPGAAAFEGTWKNENGQVTQRSGHGGLAPEAANIPIPEGGTIRISREIVMKPDGETPEMLSRKEIKQLVKTRAGMIRDALDGAYRGEAEGFRPVSEDGLTYRGTFTPAQIDAIRGLPESVVPAKIKDTILRFNELLQRGEGHRMLIDYAARVDDNGRAVPFSPKIYDLVPIGMHFSKSGNFLITTVSVSRLLDKLNLWGDRLPGRLAPWGGDKEAFFREFAETYLKNHEQGLPGETGLDPNPEMALRKKNIFNDFLNLTSREYEGANPDRSVIPRKRGDARGKDANRTIMSVRADSVADLLESSAHPLPVDYLKQKQNFLPARGGTPVEQQKYHEFDNFFSNVTKGTFGKSNVPFVPVVPLDRSLWPTIQSKQSHSGNFDDHIAKSIPTFYETQIATIHGLANSLPKGSRVLDIAASEGSYGKALTETSGGNVHTVSLDPNPDMAKFFATKSQVPGAEYSTEAFGSGWTEDDGTVVHKHDPKEAYDAIHEAMGFQFISPDRAGQIAEVKRLLKPGGLFLTEQKVKNPGWAANEKLKDTEHKNRYFTPEELAAKDREVGFSGEQTGVSQSMSETKSVGMVANQVEQSDLEDVLKQNFAHVAQYWDAGNFKGYVASDSPEALQKFLSNLPSTASKFSTTETPRAVEGTSFLPAREEETPEDIDRQIKETTDYIGRLQAQGGRYDEVREEKGLLAALEARKAALGRKKEGPLEQGNLGFLPAKAKLTHYSREERDVIEPGHEGSGIGGAELKRMRDYPDLWAPRSYYGMAGYKPEQGLGNVRHEVSVDRSSLYDYRRDPDDIYPKAQELAKKKGYQIGEANPVYSIYEGLIKKAGYTGYRVGNVAAVFKPLTPERVTRQKGVAYLPARGQDVPDEESQANRREGGQEGGVQGLRLHGRLAAVARGEAGAGEAGLPGAEEPASRKAAEEQRLRAHADKEGLWTSAEDFHKQWQLDGSEAGSEHQVTFPEGPVVKRTPNPYYPTWSEYFDALDRHNELFPRAALKFRGFQDVENGGTDIDGTKWPGGLYSEVEQPFMQVKRGLTVPETDDLMEGLGFHRIRPREYYSPDADLLITDLHGHNAVMLEDGQGNETPYVVDAIYKKPTAANADDIERVKARIADPDAFPPDIRHLPAREADGDKVPTELFHGTRSEDLKEGNVLYRIARGMYGDVVYLTTGEADAADHGEHVIPVHFAAKKPLPLFSKASPEIRKLLDSALPKGESPDKNRKTPDDWYLALEDQPEVVDEINQKLQAAGYDALWANANGTDTDYSEGSDWVMPFSTKGVTRRDTGTQFLPAKASPKDLETEEGIRSLHNKDGWAIVTAQFPQGQNPTDEENQKLLEAHQKDLEESGLPHVPTTGKYRDDGKLERGFAVFDPEMTRQKAAQMAQKYGQDSVLTREGLVYQDGSVQPSRGIQTFDQEPDNFFTTVQTPEGPKHFSADIDWDRKVGPLEGLQYLPAKAEEPPYSEKSLGQKILENQATAEGLVKKPRVDEIARWFQDRFGKPLRYDGRQTKRPQLVKQLVNEVLHAHKLHPEAAGWYDENISRMLSIAEELDPDLKKKENRFIFKTVLAATSDGSEVTDQFNDTWDIYNRWKETGELTADGISASRPGAIKNHVQKIRKLIDLLGHEGAEEWMGRRGTVKDLRESAVKDLGFLKEDADKIGVGELMDTEVPFSVLLGPKLGSFYNNLNGDHTTTTMDRWFMRTIGRLTGTQLEELTQADMYAYRQRLREAFNNLSPEERKSLKLTKGAFAGTGADSVAGKLSRYFTEASNREGNSPEMSELRKAANDLKKKQAPLIEAPANGSHRKWIREVVADVQKELKAAGVEIENADLQALLWYAEKELYGKLGYRERSRSADYASAAEALHQRVAGRPSSLASSSTGRVGNLGRRSSN